MTTNELRNELSKFEFSNWPKTYEVDADTYGNICQSIFNHELEIQTISRNGGVYFISLGLGPNNGIMFRNVELIKK